MQLREGNAVERAVGLYAHGQGDVAVEAVRAGHGDHVSDRFARGIPADDHVIDMDTAVIRTVDLSAESVYSCGQSLVRLEGLRVRDHRLVGLGVGSHLLSLDGVLGHREDAGKGDAGDQGDQAENEGRLRHLLPERDRLGAVPLLDHRLAVSKGLRRDVEVNERHRKVGNNDRVADGVGRAALNPEESGQDTDHCSEDQLARGTDRRSHIVGRHEEGAHHDAAAGQMRQQEFRIKALAAEEAHEEDEGSEHRHGDLPGDDIEDQEHQAADEQRSDGAADDAVGGAEEHLRHIDGLAGRQIRQRRRRGDAVHLEGRDRLAEGDQQEAASGERRVDEVLAESAEEVLRDEDREERAEERDVERDRRRQAQGQQKSGQGRRAVTDGVRLFADLVKYELREYRSRDGDQDHQQRGNAEIDDADHGRRKKRRDHAVHDQVRPKPAADMGAGGQIHRCIHFLPPISARFLARISALVCLNSCISGRFAGQIKVQVPQAMQSGP